MSYAINFEMVLMYTLTFPLTSTVTLYFTTRSRDCGNIVICNIS